jgi:tetratricopeptide (TPR) repeat protein
MDKHLILLPTNLHMIKNIFIPFVAMAILFAACNNTSTNTDEVSMPSKEKQLRDSIAQFPDSLLLKENLIQYFRANNNFGQAIAATEKFIQKDTANARLWDIKATLYFENADTIRSIKAFEKAIAIDPQPEYLMSLGSLYAQTKNPMALAVADSLLKKPKAKADKQALFIKGLYYSYYGDNLTAISFFDNCLSLDYRDIMAYREKAICLYNLAKYKEAIQSLEKAVALQSTYDEGFYWMGRCYEKLNSPKEAIINYQTALRIDPDYAEAKDALAKLGVSN